MKVTMLQGSPRRKGNTAQVLAWMQEEMLAQGHDVGVSIITGKDINGCLACAKCKDTPDAIGCIQKDDVAQMLEHMVASDLVVYASPLYFWGVSAQLKTIIDRSYALYVNYHQPNHASLIQGKRQALVLTGGGAFENNAEAAITAFQRLQKPHLTVNAGELFIGPCSTPDKLGEEQKAKALAFARKICAE